MKKKICKKIMLSALAAVTVLTTVLPIIPANAESKEVISGEVDFGQGDASLVIMGSSEQPLAGKKFEIYRLFDAENSLNEESINYTYNDTYKSALQTVVGERLERDADKVTEYQVIDYIHSLNSYVIEGAHANQTLEKSYSDFRYFVEDLRDEIKAQNLDGDIVTVTSTNSANYFTISGLPYGYYVIDEITDVNGTNSAASLCMVNTANPTADIVVKSDYPSVEKKVLEENNDTGIERSISMWADVVDCEIGQTLYFQALSDVPYMNGYDTYYFAWHDAMDAVFAFNPESVYIEITDPAKTYVLDPEEYSVTEMEPGSDTTFKVEITDLKAIVDREFNNIDENGENIYSQQINMSYSAVLTTDAAIKVGKPGIENDIRIEFSNNPDSDGAGSTGFSAWDTTACFTYVMKVHKENQYETRLQGAKFKLYNDEACEDEINFVETEGGYIIVNDDSVGPATPVALTDTEDEEQYMISGSHGTFNIYGLDSSKPYYLKEVEAPAGYRKIEDPIIFYIGTVFTGQRFHYVKGDGASDGLIKQFISEAQIRDFYFGEWETMVYELETDVDAGAAYLTIVNYVGTKLPATGSSMTIILISLGVACTVIAFYTKKRANKK